MARPFKARRVCSQPMVEVFGPLDQDAATRVELTLEEYETIRLIDLLDCTRRSVPGRWEWPGPRSRRFIILPGRNWRIVWSMGGS